MATVRRGLILGALAGLGVFFLWRKKASAAEEVPIELPTGEVVLEPNEPPPPDAPPPAQTEAVAPRSEFPWMAYSGRTLQIQQAINDWRNLIGQSEIAEDGILGPETCRAWWAWYREDQFASINPPASCNGYG